MQSKIIAAALGVLALLTIGYFAGGGYDVSANERHWPVTESLLGFVRDRSIHAHAEEIEVPNLEDERLILKGAMQFKEMCVQCHLDPETETTELYKGLYPKPPRLHRNNHAHDPRATFWVIKNGLKMTGMPAWGPTHDDETLWSLVAFIERLRGLEPAAYRALMAQAHDAGIPHSH